MLVNPRETKGCDSRRSSVQEKLGLSPLGTKAKHVSQCPADCQFVWQISCEEVLLSNHIKEP